MFMRPASIHTRARWRAFDLSAVLGLLKKRVCPQACPAWMHAAGSPPGLMGEWNTIDLIYCNKPYDPGISYGAGVFFPGRAASIHPCAVQVQVLSPSVGPQS